MLVVEWSEDSLFPLTGTEALTRGEAAEASAHSWMDAGWLLCGVGLGSLGHKRLKAAKSRVKSNNEQLQAASTAPRHKAAQGQGNLAGRTVMEALLCSELAAQLHGALEDGGLTSP